ncbi:hypothetical protein GCM10007352_12600 [Mucilaginibacter phyllosphaerae]|nr:hypothetical protein GCM10007352_12600 [Mucilaginibacter phyllosphaerae]
MGMIILSCKSQTTTDLLSLKVDSDLSGFVLQDKALNKEEDPNFGLTCLNTNKIDGYAIGDVRLSTYAYPNANLADYSNLSIFVSAKDKNIFLGFNYSSVNQKETRAIINYLKKIYPTYQQSDTKGNGESFFLDIPKLNAWIFTYQGISKNKDNSSFFSTNFIFVKKGTRMENSADTKVQTIRDYYKMMYPDLLAK